MAKIYVAYIPAENPTSDPILITSDDGTVKEFPFKHAAWEAGLSMLKAKTAFAFYYSESTDSAIQGAKASADHKMREVAQASMVAKAQPSMTAKSKPQTELEAIPVSMLIKATHTTEDGVTISDIVEYTDRAKANAAYIAAKKAEADGSPVVSCGYRTVTVRFKKMTYTFLTNRDDIGKTITIDGDRATVVSKELMTRKQLTEMAAAHGKKINEFFRVI